MLIAALTLLLLGTALAVRGLIGRRVGDEPRCRKCKYNLTGVESKECPECGRVWTPETAARGLRKRRRLPLTLGLILLVVGAPLLTPAVRRHIAAVNWWTHLPTRWVLREVERNYSPRAFRVIHDRVQQNQLSPSDRNAVIEAALRMQKTGGANLPGLVNVLGWLHQRGMLSIEQSQRYLNQLVSFTLRIRPKIRAGEDLPIEIRTEARSPEPSVFIGFFMAEDFTIDAQPVPTDPTARLELTLNGCTWNDELIQVPSTHLDPGRHTLRLTVHARIFNKNAGFDTIKAFGAPIVDRYVQLSGEFECVARSDPDSLQVDSTEATASLIKSIFVVRAQLHTSSGAADSRLSVEIWLKKPSPIDAVFDAYAITPSGRRYECGHFQLRRGEGFCLGRQRYIGDYYASIDPGDQVDILLVFDPAQARQSVHVMRTWQGELVFKSIPVQQARRRFPAPLTSAPAR